MCWWASYDSAVTSWLKLNIIPGMELARKGERKENQSSGDPPNINGAMGKGIEVTGSQKKLFKDAEKAK